MSTPFFYSASNGTAAIHIAPTGAVSSIVLPMEQTPGAGSAVFFYSAWNALGSGLAHCAGLQQASDTKSCSDRFTGPWRRPGIARHPQVRALGRPRYEPVIKPQSSTASRSSRTVGSARQSHGCWRCFPCARPLRPRHRLPLACPC